MGSRFGGRAQGCAVGRPVRSTWPICLRIGQGRHVPGLRLESCRPERGPIRMGYGLRSHSRGRRFIRVGGLGTVLHVDRFTGKRGQLGVDEIHQRRGRQPDCGRSGGLDAADSADLAESGLGPGSSSEQILAAGPAAYQGAQLPAHRISLGLRPPAVCRNLDPLH